jgi:cysteine-rich repeat protein
MRSPRNPWLVTCAAIGALLAFHTAGCGGQGSTTTQSGGTTTGPGGGTSSSGSTGGGKSTSSSGTGGATSTSSGGGAGGKMMAVCGDGVVEGSEQCDLGMANGTGVGCNSMCDFDCAADADCNPMNDPCAGTATCVGATVQGQTVKQCMPGTPLANGASCGAGLFCVNMNCVAPACGDGVVEAPEECDDGNTTNGDGCDTDCKFSCVSSDPTRDCASANACVTGGACDDATHTCSAGTPVADGTGCGAGQICVGGTCTAATCGDGLVTPPEQCDFGAGNNVAGSGCQPGCTFSCTTAPNSCDDGNPCNGQETCTTVTGPNGKNGQKCAAGVPLPDGTSCGGGKICKNQVCSAPAAVCGNGIVEAGEQCDLGAMNGAGQGCSATCRFDCQTNADCTSANPCVAGGTCAAGTVNGQMIQKCQAGADSARCTACPTGFCDGAGTCKASACGDGCLDPSKGEQCDDGNLHDLDGCDSACKYEVVARMTSVAISGTQAPAALGCMPATNRLGAQALTSTALGQLNPDLTTDVNGGTVNVMTQFLGLTDLTGVSSAPFSIGVLDATPDPAKGAWPGNNPIDWWFLADPATVSMGLPTGRFTNATLAARNLAAGPSNITLTLNLGGSPAQLTMLGAHIAASINGNPPPDVPAPPPAALAPGLTVFQTISGNGAGQGLCGNITVASLAAIPVPATLAQGGGTACGACGGSHTYTACTGTQTPNNSSCNSLLDVLVGGCKVVACFVTVVNPEQPDVPAGAMVTPLALGAGNKVPVATTMNDSDAYSSYLTFTANRAHFTGESCTATAQCQAGLTCTGGVCK